MHNYGPLPLEERGLQHPCSDTRRLRSAASRGARGPLLWEGDHACPFERILAAAGVAEWADVTMPDGRWAPWHVMATRFGLAGPAAADAYVRVTRHLRALAGDAPARWRDEVQAGRAQVGPMVTLAADRRGGTHSYPVRRVLAARRTARCFGGWEYLLEWEGDFPDSWEYAKLLGRGPALRADCKRARLRAYRPHTFRDWLHQQCRTGDADDGLDPDLGFAADGLATAGLDDGLLHALLGDLCCLLQRQTRLQQAALESNNLCRRSRSIGWSPWPRKATRRRPTSSQRWRRGLAIPLPSLNLQWL